MDVWRITVAVVRRWYVFLPLIALTVLGVLEVGEGVDPQYEVTATAILVPGTASSEIDNPYGSMDETNQVLSIVVEGTEARERIEAAGLEPGYELDPRSRSRIMNFLVVSDSPEVGLTTGDAVLELARQELAERQGAVGIPEDAQVGLQVLQAPTVAEVVTEGKTRSMAIVGVLGSGFAVLVAVLFDDLVGLLKRWLAAWRKRRAARKGTSEDVESPSSDVPDGSDSTEGRTQGAVPEDADDAPAAEGADSGSDASPMTDDRDPGVSPAAESDEKAVPSSAFTNS